MKFYQIALEGHAPQGALFESRAAAMREVRFLQADDRRYAEDALREAGIVVAPSVYVVHEVVR